jgi:hyperosmotically inducible periplasmic protein
MLKNPNAKLLLVTLMSVAAALSFSACGQKDQTTGQKVDAVIADTKEAAKDTQAAVKDAASSVEKSAEKAASATSDGAGKVVVALDDAAITTSIAASFAKDPDLSAIKIDIDTKNGSVTLQGPAPTDLARTRATSIAQSVKGVVSVNNMLTVKPAG